MSEQVKKYALVTAGDIQVFAAIITTAVKNRTNFPDGREVKSFADAAEWCFCLYDAVKAEDDRRKAATLDEIRKPK